MCLLAELDVDGHTVGHGQQVLGLRLVCLGVQAAAGLQDVPQRRDLLRDPLGLLLEAGQDPLEAAHLCRGEVVVREEGAQKMLDTLLL